MRHMARLPALLLGAAMVVGSVHKATAFNDTTASSCGVAAGRDVNGTVNTYCRDPADIQQIARLLADVNTQTDARHAAELRAEQLAAEAQTTKGFVPDVVG